jgi:hypothetical protein
MPFSYTLRNLGPLKIGGPRQMSTLHIGKDGSDCFVKKTQHNNDLLTLPGFFYNETQTQPYFRT